MPAPDYRIRFQSPLIDFDTQVGNESQDIDQYPSPYSQARYDHMRMVLLGLLAQQASSSPPTQFRNGTPWFDLNSETIKIRRQDEWVSLSEAIRLEEISGNEGPTTLQAWYDSVNGAIRSLQNELYFGGRIVSLGVDAIPIPLSIRKYVGAGSRAFVYVNGMLVNPTLTPIDSVSNPTTIAIPTEFAGANSIFSVLIKKIPNEKFLQEQILI
jgi:hypothetical protein